MHLENLRNISDDNINFNTKVIDIDFYNVTNRNLFLGHVGDYNLYVLHLIIPKDNAWADPMQVILSYQNNTLSEAKWIANPSKIVGNSYYFLIKGDIVSTAGEGFLQFQVILPSNDATTKTVIAKSKKIPYVVEESLTLEGSAEEVTPEQMSSIDSLINDYTNLIDAYEVTDLKMLNKRVSDLETLNGYENLYNPFLNTYSIVRLDLASNTVYTVNYNPSNPTTSILPDGTIQTAAHIRGNYRELFYNPDFKTKAGEKYRISGKVIIHKNRRNSIAEDKRKMDCFFINSVADFSTSDTNKIQTSFFTEELSDSDVTTASPLESAWFFADFTVQEDGAALIFGAFPESSTVTTNTTTNDSPVKITNFILTKIESVTTEDSIFSRYSKNDLEKTYKEVIPVSIYKEDKVLEYLKRAREKKEYYLIDSNSYADGISIIDDTSFIDPNDTTNYSIPNPYILSVPSNSSTVEFFDTRTKENWIYDIEQGQTEFEVKNLIPEHLYVYTFKNSNSDIINSNCLKIKGPIRFIDIGVNGTEEEIVNNIDLKPKSTIFNVRDLGGWKCDRGKLKYGVIYRGSTLSDLYEGTTISLSSSQKQFLVDKLKIRDEISLRWASEISGRTFSVLNGVSEQQVGYKNFDIGYYNPLTGPRPGIIASIIKRLSNNIRNNKTTYIHCSAGADRTALICSIIEAICGVSQIDLDCDYEITSLAIDRKKISKTKYGRRLTRDRDPYGDNNNWGRGYLFQELRNKGNGNLRDGTINFLLENGVTREEIDIIRAGLIEYEEPKELLIDDIIDSNQDEQAHNKLYVPNTQAVIDYIAGQVLNSLPLMSTLGKSTDLNGEQINSICTVLGSTANRPTGVTGICLTLGTTRGGGVIAQLILSTTSKIYLRYKAGNGAVYGAWKECASAQELAQLRDESAQELEQFREELVNEGTNLLYLPDGTFEQSGTGNVKAVIKDQVITLSGNATGTAKYINIPVSVEMGSGTYTLKRFLDYADFSIMLAENTTSPGVVNVSKGSTDSNTVTLAAAAAPKYIRIYIPASVPEGTSLSSVFRLELKKSSTVPNAWESPVLLKKFLMPGLPLMSTLKSSTDLDNEQINSICTVISDTANRPTGVIGICLTLGTTVSGGVKAQLILSTASKIFLRYKAGNGAIYTNWSEIGAGQGSQPEVKVPPAIDAFGIFDTVGFIGDSLGSGWADANGALTKDDPTLNKNDYDVSWLQFMCRRTGRTGYNFSYGGATTTSWLTNKKGAALLQTAGYKCQAYIIGLGVNDSREEAVPSSTFSTNYAEIISIIRSVSDKAPIFCIKIPKDDLGVYNKVSEYNAAITNIVNNNAGNSVYLIEPEVAKINSLFNQYKDIYHYSALGYARIAEYMLELLNACVEENKGDFVQLNLLESDPKEYYTKAEVDALIESLRNELTNQ